MLGELAAANAAFQIIKQTVQNGGEIAKAGKAIGQFLTAKEDLMREGNKKRARGVGGNDLEEFMALEEIKEKEEQLKQMMIYLGRPGLHSDWVRFQVEARKNRKEAAEQQAKDRAELAQNIQTFLIWFLSIAVVTGVIALSIAIAQRKGWI